MDEIIDLPAPPLRTTVVEGELRGAEVAATLMTGKTLRGRLARLSRAQAMLSLRLEQRDEALDIALSELRYLHFCRELPVSQGVHPLEQRGREVHMPEPVQKFHVAFVDGKTLSGKTRGSFVDELGLHFFRLLDRNKVTRLYVPLEVVKEYQVGPLLGAALVKQKRVRQQDVDAAADEQGALRGKRIGKYLQNGIALNAAQLQQALELQAKYPAEGREAPPARKLGEILVDKKMVTHEQLADALEIQHGDRRKKLGEILAQKGMVANQDVSLTLARKLGLPFVKLHNFDIDTGVLSLLPIDIAQKYHLIPLFLYRDRLVVAMDDPTDVEAIDMLRFISGRSLELAVAMKEDIEQAIAKYYGGLESMEAEDELEVSGGGGEEEQKRRELREIERLAKGKPIVRLVNNTLLDAIRRRASDVHIRPLEDDVDLMFRIDGTLIKIRSFSKALLPAIISRIKIIGRMDIAERRLPQDGRTSLVDGDAVVDLRISVVPTIEGESAVIRILNASTGLKSIGELGFGPHDQTVFTDLLHKSYGILLVTGPTGSGKSTTLYAALHAIQMQNVNIITVEDPVEYHLQGLEQIQVSSATGYTFAKALRHILRHDPDVIMIGEMRDQETCKIAIESALTGHLVLSTLHTNDAASAVTRLMEMGVEPYLLSATLLGILAQRLVRCNCPHCMRQEEVEPAVRQALGVSEDEVFYKGAGCEYCNDTGYSGRLAVYELLPVTNALRAQMTAGVAADKIHRQAVADGMVPLTENALAQARQRKTSLAEAYRVRLE